MISIVCKVATNLENMENLENSGNLKNCQNLMKTQGNLNLCGKNLENSGKMKNMGHDRQQKCISLNFPLLSRSGKNFKMTWKSQGI